MRIGSHTLAGFLAQVNWLAFRHLILDSFNTLVFIQQICLWPEYKLTKTLENSCENTQACNFDAFWFSFDSFNYIRAQCFYNIFLDTFCNRLRCLYNVLYWHGVHFCHFFLSIVDCLLWKLSHYHNQIWVANTSHNLVDTADGSSSYLSLFVSELLNETSTNPFFGCLFNFFFNNFRQIQCSSFSDIRVIVGCIFETFSDSFSLR